MTPFKDSTELSRRRFIGGVAAMALPLPVMGQPVVQGREVNLLALGDWGASPKTKDPDDAPILLKYQKMVAKAMVDYSAKLAAEGKSLAAILALGDNFYGGLKGPDDPRMTSGLDTLYPPAALNAPFYFALGNHEYEDGDEKSGQYQMERGRANEALNPQGRWRFPAAPGTSWYGRSFPASNPLVSMEVLNTNEDYLKDDWKRQMKWLDEQPPMAARWRIMVGHHPMFTDGYHWDREPSLYDTLRKAILPRLKDHVFYISGHDHNMQHIHHPGYPDVDFLLAGSGGGDFLKKRKNVGTIYQNEFMLNFGFLHLRFTETDATASFIAATGDKWRILHEVKRT